MKKNLGFALLVSAGVALSGCKLPATSNLANIGIVKKDTIALQATTALTLADSFTHSATMQKIQKQLLDEGTPVVDIPVATLDILFNNGSSFNIEKTTSDREGYAYLDIISFNIGAEEDITYSLYYNLETSDTEVPDEDEESIPSEDIPTDVTDDTTGSEIGQTTEEQTTTSQEIALRHGEGHGHGGNHDDDKGGDRDRGDEDEIDDEADDTEDEAENEDDEDRGNGHGHGMSDDDDEDEDKGHHGGHGNGNGGRGEGRGNHYRLTGLAVVGDEEYRFMSKTETETDDDETETELKFMLFKSEGNFIMIKQEIEIEGVVGEVGYEYEEEFRYLVVENDEVVKQFKLELENEDDQLALEVKIDGVKYEVEYVTAEDKLFIHVTVAGDQTYIYEKVITTNTETGVTTVDYILQ